LRRNHPTVGCSRGVGRTRPAMEIRIRAAPRTRAEAVVDRSSQDPVGRRSQARRAPRDRLVGVPTVGGDLAEVAALRHRNRRWTGGRRCSTAGSDAGDAQVGGWGGCPQPFSETNSARGRPSAQPSDSSEGRSGKSGTGPRQRIATGSASAGIDSSDASFGGSKSDTHPIPRPSDRAASQRFWIAQETDARSI
jgi:hypothetical protein